MIGIGITTCNRYSTFKNTYEHIQRLAPPDARIVVVDDNSDFPVQEATFRFETQVGIARAKNKCLELLDQCEHIFLFDDDTYPLESDWWKHYVDSVEPHLMYIFQDFSGPVKLNDTALLYHDGKIKIYSHPRGCMLYFKRICLEKVGGMDPVFGRWGWEHVHLSDRIHNAGLTTGRYMDVANSKGLFYAADEHQAVTSTVWGEERRAQIWRNQVMYERMKNDTHFIPYKETAVKEDILITTYFNSVGDCQRENTRWAPDYEALSPLIKSLQGNKLVILNDCLYNTDTDNVKHVRVDTYISPYWQRWISIYQYLQRHSEIGRLFCIDATDVELLHNPFDVDLGDWLYIADEPDPIGCEWMHNHFPAQLIQNFIRINSDKTLLNAGVIGGRREIVMQFLHKVLSVYFDLKTAEFKREGRSPGDIDMGVINYVAYTFFLDRIRYGRQVNTIFKAYEYNNISWFKHK